METEEEKRGRTKEEVQDAFRKLRYEATVKIQSTQFIGPRHGKVTAICCHDNYNTDYFSVKFSGNGNIPSKCLIADIFFLKRTN